MTIQRNDIIFVKDHAVEAKGSVQYSNRPAVVIQNNLGNTYSPTLIVAYLTGKIKKVEMSTHVVLSRYKGLKKTSMFMAEQIATIPKDDVKDVMDHLREEDILRINYALFASLDLKKRTNGCSYRTSHIFDKNMDSGRS